MNTVKVGKKWGDYYRLYNMFEFKEITVFNFQKGLMGRDITSLVYLKRTGQVGTFGDKKGVGGFIIDGITHLPIADNGDELVCLVSLEDIAENIADIKNPVLSFITFK